MKTPKTIALYGYVPIPGRSIGYIVYVGESELSVANRAIAEAYGVGARLDWVDESHAEVVRPDPFGVMDVLVDPFPYHRLCSEPEWQPWSSRF